MTDPRQDLGLRAESAVAAWLESAGWRVLARRWRSATGELDLICTDPDRALVGIEVRARRSSRAGTPEESIDGARVHRLRRTLAAYAALSPERHRALRIDVVAASALPGSARVWRLRRVAGVDGW